MAASPLEIFTDIVMAPTTGIYGSLGAAGKKTRHEAGEGWDRVSGAKAARDNAKRAAGDQEEAANRLQREAMAQKKKDAAYQEAQQARNRLKTLSNTAGGKRDTILTSPLGSAGPYTAANKSLIGQ